MLVKTFVNFAVLEQSTKLLTAKFSLSPMASLPDNPWVCHYFSQRRQPRDCGCCFPLARKEVFVQQHFSKLPHRPSSMDQQSLKLHLVCQFLLHFIVGVATCHTHTLSLSTIRESFNHKNSTFSNLRKFFTHESFPLCSIQISERH